MNSAKAKEDNAMNNEVRPACPDVKELSFEAALRELEQIVNRLERGDVGLEQSIAIYERGEQLRVHCDQLLRRAEAKVEKITLNAQGEPAGAEPFDAGR
jgi:exodeoxyribonuclease VII small subunit